MLKAIFASSAVLAVANSAALEPRAKQPAPAGGIQQFLTNYNFETYPPTTLSGAGDVDLQVVNDYDLLHFNTLLINETQAGPVTGVACHTLPACSAFALNTQILGGVLGGGQNPISLGPAYITAAYQYSPVSYFTPYVFYYGCAVAAANGAASLPASCNITATGQTSSGETVYSQMFQYTANSTLQQMVPGFFDLGWSGLRIQTLYLSVTNNATTTGLFDNFVANVYGPRQAAVTVDF